MKTKFEVPFNGDLAITDLYKDYKEYIAYVYGRAEDHYPQGRNTKQSALISLNDIEKVVRVLDQNGIKFNYLLNGNCHGNREFNPEYRKSFIEFVKCLSKRGVKGVTIGNPLLLEIVKDSAPEMDIFASVLLEIDNLTRAKQIIKAGADYVCLSKTLLKNFAGLEKISKSGIPMDSFILLANDPCLHNCALTQYHNTSLSHASSENGEYVNYCRLHCNQDFASDPRKVISASFIRPEDLQVYENLGFNFFKLCERKQTTPWIRNVLSAYVRRSYNGDLAELMGPWSNIGKKYPYPEIINEDDIEKKGLVALRQDLRFEPSINNRALDGYLDFWIKIKRAGCGNENCDACNYCSEVANKAYYPDEARNKIIYENTGKVLKHSRRVK